MTNKAINRNPIHNNNNKNTPLYKPQEIQYEMAILLSLPKSIKADPKYEEMKKLDI